MNPEYPCLQPFYKNILDETLSDPVITKEIEFVWGFFEEWVGNFIHPIGKDLHRANQSESILYCYMASQSLTFDWLSHSILLGNYETVLRELRSILENLFFTFHLDIHHKNKTIKDKYEILEQLEISNRSPYGKVVFENSGYCDWKPYYDLYKELCKYIHVHTETTGRFVLEIASTGFPQALDAKYSQNSFLKCSKIWREISKIAVSLVECLFQKLGIDVRYFDPNHLAEVWGA